VGDLKELHRHEAELRSDLDIQAQLAMLHSAGPTAEHEPFMQLLDITSTLQPLLLGEMSVADRFMQTLLGRLLPEVCILFRFLLSILAVKLVTVYANSPRGYGLFY
jgi:hypothetical protein